MGKYMRKCRGMGEVALMEVGPPLTRARTLALAAAAAAAAAGGKRRRVGGGELQLRSRRAVGQPDKQVPCRKSVRTAADRIRSGSGELAAPSRCSSNGSCELEAARSMRSAAEPVEVGERLETAAGFDSTRSGRGRTTSSSVQVEAEELDSATTTPPSGVGVGPGRRTEAARMPSAGEIDDFFAAAEMRERKRFADKYNYDVEKDVPLAGRYEWVRLIPEQAL